jgi:hypothetical protein
MRLREEMEERAKAVLTARHAGADDPLMSGWTIHSDDWSDVTQAAVDQVMARTNAVFDTVLRLAEAVDELRDASDVEG